jgi:hypothetical protein
MRREYAERLGADAGSEEEWSIPASPGRRRQPTESPRGGGNAENAADPEPSEPILAPAPLPRRLTEGEAEAVLLMKSLFAGARRALEAAARTAGANLQDLATTLMVALVTTDAVVLAQVGDGVVAVRSTSGAILGPVAPQRGEYANEATFITAGEDLPDIVLASFPSSKVDAFGLSSDGLRLLITSNSLEGTPHAPFFADVFTGVASGLSSEAIAQFLSQAQDRTGDDKSLVVGVRVP